MKRFLAALCLIFIVCVVSAQEYRDCVYLKNGSIIKGTVVTQDSESLTVVTADGSQFVYKMKDVTKITKETIANKRSSYTRKALPLNATVYGLSTRVVVFEGEKDIELTEAQIREKLGYDYQAFTEACNDFKIARYWEYGGIGCGALMFGGLFAGLASLNNHNETLSKAGIIVAIGGMVGCLTGIIVGTVSDKHAFKKIDSIMKAYNDSIASSSDDVKLRISPNLAMLPATPGQPSQFAPGLSLSLTF